MPVIYLHLNNSSTISAVHRPPRRVVVLFTGHPDVWWVCLLATPTCGGCVHWPSRRVGFTQFPTGRRYAQPRWRRLPWLRRRRARPLHEQGSSWRRRVRRWWQRREHRRGFRTGGGGQRCRGGVSSTCGACKYLAIAALLPEIADVYTVFDALYTSAVRCLFLDFICRLKLGIFADSWQIQDLKWWKFDNM